MPSPDSPAATVPPIAVAATNRRRRPRLIPADTPRWLLVVLTLCLFAGLLRIAALYLHTPLIGLANSYDEVRYSACFDLYPDRARTIPPTQNSPQTPYARYRFIADASPICYWSTELLFQGAAAAVYHLDAAATGATSFSVRWIGAFKILALIGLWLAFSVAWLHRREPWSALTNGLLLPVVFADPANTIYLNTFYAEWTALLALYAVTGLILIHTGKPARGHAFALLAIAASALAMSKIQHMRAAARRRDRDAADRTLARSRLAVERQRAVDRRACRPGSPGRAIAAHSEAIRAINVFNQADVVFTALLPNARDPAVTAQRLGLSPQCLQYSGLRAWQMPGYPADAVSGVAQPDAFAGTGPAAARAGSDPAPGPARSARAQSLAGAGPGLGRGRRFHSPAGGFLHSK